MSDHSTNPRASSPAIKLVANDRFSDWTVLSFAGKHGAANYWLCRCACGQLKEVRASALASGRTGGCGKGCPARLERSFWAHVQKTDACWLWTGHRDPKGYGRHKRCRLVHRYSYELHYGKIEGGLFVCHRCDNPPCVRPDHLFLGTVFDNAADMVRKGRQCLGERQGNAKLSADAVRDIRSSRAAGVAARTLALRYGISVDYVGRLVLRQHWRHVQ